MADSACKSRPLGLLLTAALVLVMQGCASLSKDECITADWYGIGYEDGLHGKPADQIASHRKACAKHGVTADLARYSEGREAGLEHFCEPRNGYRLGRAGTGYGGVCPAHTEDRFLQAYGAGREIYNLQQAVRRLEHAMDGKQAKLQELDAAIAAKEAELIHAGVTPQRREAMLVDLRDLENAAAQVQSELQDMGDSLQHRSAELDHKLAQAPDW